MKRWITYTLVALAVTAVIALAAWPKPAQVEIATVSVGAFRQVVEEDARTHVREHYTVSAPVAGTLARIDLHPGDAVEPGTVLARLQPLPSPLLDPRYRAMAEQRLDSARDTHLQSIATVSRAETALTLARSTLERTRTLVAHEAEANSQLEQADADMRMRESELQSVRFAERVAAHGVEEAQSQISSFSARGGQPMDLTSPVRGRVLHVLRESAGVVAAGDALTEVGDPSSLEVIVQVLSPDAVLMRPGMAATLTHWGGDAPLHAHVRRVEPAAFTHISALGVEEQRVNVLLDLEDPEVGTRLLGDGFAVEAQIVTWSGERVVQVPTSALFRRGESWAVYAVAGGRAVVRSVTVGHRGPLRCEVRDGLRAGDTVIVHPSPTLVAGARVKAL